jgi:hypothetical protein
MPIVEQKIAKLNKRAAKLGAEPITIVVVKKWDKHFQEQYENYDPIGCPVKVIPMTTIQVIGVAPKLNGWSLIAVAEPIESGILLRKFPGTEIEIPVEFRDVTPERCDHCHTERQRNETFIVHHDTGDWKVVGRTCLKDFTGANSPERIADYASALCDLMLSIKDDEQMSLGGGGSGGYYQAPIRSFLKMVAIYSARHGFVTATQAKKHNENMDADSDSHYLTPTGKLVFDFFFVPNGYRNKERKDFMDSITDAEDEMSDDLVDAAMQWGKTQFVDEEESKLSDYGHNMKLLLGANHVRIIDVGFVASVISGYKRSISPKVDYKGSGYIGTIGQKVAIPVTVVKIHDWEGQYGLVHITTMQDEQGNILTWFAPGKLPAMKEGAYKVMTGTVKRHDERNGYKSTVVNYCKFA